MIRPRYRPGLLKLVTALVALATVAGGCSTSGGVRLQSGDSLSDKSIDCPKEITDGDFAPSPAYVASVEHWYEVDTSTEVDPSLTKGDKTVSAELKAWDRGGNDEAQDGGAELTREFYLNASILRSLPGLHADQGAHLYLAVGRKGYPREIVLYGLAVSADDASFVGGCAASHRQAEMTAYLGDDFVKKLSGLVGLSATAAAHLLGVTDPKVPTESETLLNPEQVDKKVLDSLGKVTLYVRRPASWVGPYTICTRIDQGWNDCFSLADPVKGSVAIGAYVGEGNIEVWLADEKANLTAPLEQLGALKISRERLDEDMAYLVELSGEWQMTTGSQIRGASAEVVSAYPTRELMSSPALADSYGIEVHSNG